MPVDRKHMKVGVAALAASALIIGLSVGLTQKNRSNQSSQLAATGYRMSDCIYVEPEVDTYYSKGGKSRRLSSSKLRGLGSTNEVYEEESTNDGKDSADIEIEQEPGYYGKSEGSYGSYGSKGGKSSGSYGSKGGKSGVEQEQGLVEFCVNECDYFIEQNPCLTSGSKSGKGSYGSYGGSKASGEGYGSYSGGKSGKSGGYDTFESPCDGVYSYGGKSGKSGGENYESYEGGKSGKSGDYGSYSEGKSSKGSIYEQVCLTPTPTPEVIPPTPPSIDIPIPPPSPTPDPCEDPIIQVVIISGEEVCSNGDFPTADGYGDMAFINFKTCCNTLVADGVLDADEECPIEDVCRTPTPAPTACEAQIINVVTINGELECSNGDYTTADGYGDMAFTSFDSCCNTLIADGVLAAGAECPIIDECGTPTPPTPPAPTPTTPAPVETPIETYEPTTGSTPTVATEAVSDIVDMGPRL